MDGGAREWKRVNELGVSGMRSLCRINLSNIDAAKTRDPSARKEDSRCQHLMNDHSRERKEERQDSKRTREKRENVLLTD